MSNYGNIVSETVEHAIQAKGLSKRFGDKLAVNKLDLNIPKGSIYGFLGPNGCGKSTSIRLLTGLLTPTEGDVTILGKPLLGNEELFKKRIGYMTQKFSLYDTLTVEENLNFVGSIYSFSRQRKKVRVQELLHLYGLEQQKNQLAGSMSGGQKQRLALACATLHSPELLFLDEPTSAVDPQNRREFWERLFDLCDVGTTILVSTHYMDEAERCHALAILEQGKKRADGSPQTLMDAMPAHVVEVSGDKLRELKHTLIINSNVLSAAQIGAHLRVLVKHCVQDPLTFIAKFSNNRKALIVRPSLEDVFVACTGGRNVD
ncbi:MULTISPECIES: ABC transporter ATP-binding protein [Pseudoalteromonas]|uniref:ABC transporter ATP-binding protein n=1 Tax=Pseudoalteromonas fuliginea TaxID=1872678 RepID=A0A833ELX5_9GAMM|nr:MULTISPECIES: ABC transporter ATP-binding protein [Pseudoalteromonas]KAA1156490.1 ABC transporter ATP-binding protein [Pseudoalteromonas fuliginea]KAA1156655.1 ABC transporter ATP-binding protein [Pseudoalteromonas fuliginea]KAA1167484.1 ABC transporter ATP-binding protein [Pseudoalteromonas fuliginea]